MPAISSHAQLNLFLEELILLRICAAICGMPETEGEDTETKAPSGAFPAGLEDTKFPTSVGTVKF